MQEVLTVAVKAVVSIAVMPLMGAVLTVAGMVMLFLWLGGAVE